jgi:hypothetical protein
MTEDEIIATCMLLGANYLAPVYTTQPAYLLSPKGLFYCPYRCLVWLPPDLKQLTDTEYLKLVHENMKAAGGGRR